MLYGFMKVKRGKYHASGKKKIDSPLFLRTTIPRGCVSFPLKKIKMKKKKKRAKKLNLSIPKQLHPLIAAVVLIAGVALVVGIVSLVKKTRIIFIKHSKIRP